MEYRNYFSLAGKTLRRGDVVWFYDLRYLVEHNYLNNYARGNDHIFDRLKVNKYKFASEFYGYPVKIGDWPSSNNEDYPALTRLCLGIYAKMLGVDTPNVKDFNIYCLNLCK